MTTKKKIRVLYIIGGDDDKYGAQRLAKTIISSLKTDNNIEFCVLITHHGLINTFCDEQRIENHIFGFKYCTYVPMKNKLLSMLKHSAKKCFISLKNYQAIRQIEKEIDIRSFDIIHSNINRDLIGGYFSQKYQIPHIWHIQEMYDSHFGLSPIYKHQIEWMNSHCTKFIAISNAVAVDWINHSIAKSKVQVIYNGIDIDKYHIIEKDQDDNILHIVMAGLIYREKGQEQVIEALTLLPQDIRDNVRLDLYGEAKEKYYSYLCQYIYQHDLQNIVTFKGYSNNMPEILPTYDVGINCSKSEGFGLSTLEYMASGLCVLVTKGGANTELIKDRQNGLLIDYGKPSSIAEKIKEIYHNTEERMRLQRNAHETSKKYSIKICVQEIYNMYSKIVR